MAKGKLPPVHPGDVLQMEFLVPLGLSQYRLAKDTSVPPRASTKLSAASVPSAPILLCAWQGTSGPPTDSGPIFKFAMTWKWRGIGSAIGSSERCEFLPDPATPLFQFRSAVRTPYAVWQSPG